MKLSYLSILVIIIALPILIITFFSFTPSTKYVNNTEMGYLTLNNKTMICNFTYLCFLREDGKWHKPAYSTNANLILANNIKVENSEKIKNFFNRSKIAIVVNTTQGVVETLPFAYYLGYYFERVENRSLEVNSMTYSQYDFKEPALIILGPSPGMKNEIKVEGENIIVTSSSRKNLAQLLGKLLLIVVS